MWKSIREATCIHRDTHIQLWVSNFACFSRSTKKAYIELSNSLIRKLTITVVYLNLNVGLGQSSFLHLMLACLWTIFWPGPEIFGFFTFFGLTLCDGGEGLLVNVLHTRVSELGHNLLAALAPWNRGKTLAYTMFVTYVCACGVFVRKKIPCTLKCCLTGFLPNLQITNSLLLPLTNIAFNYCIVYLLRIFMTPLLKQFSAHLFPP